MKKDGSRKLSLNRETLKPLVDDELAGVNGGESYSFSRNSFSRQEQSVSVSRSNSGSHSAPITPFSKVSFSYSGSR
jgi:hypothetical protein